MLMRASGTQLAPEPSPACHGLSRMLSARDQARDTRPRAFRIVFASARLRSQITTWSLTSTIYRSSSLDCFRSSAIASLLPHDVGIAGRKITPASGGLSTKAFTETRHRDASLSLPERLETSP